MMNWRIVKRMINTEAKLELEWIRLKWKRDETVINGNNARNKKTNTFVTIEIVIFIFQGNRTVNFSNKIQLRWN